MKNRFS